MIDVNLLNLFEACSRMPSRSRSPLAVSRRHRFPVHFKLPQG